MTTYSAPRPKTAAFWTATITGTLALSTAVAAVLMLALGH